MKKKSGSTMSKEIVPKTERLTVSDAPGGGGGGALAGSFGSSGGGASPPVPPGNAGARDGDDVDSVFPNTHNIIRKGQHKILFRDSMDYYFINNKILDHFY